MPELPADRPAAAAAILAGGAGHRIGGNKAEVPLAGRPLISYPVTALRRAGLNPFVVTKADRPVAGIAGLEGVPVVFEPDRPRHPLAGLLAALEHAGGAAVVVVGCDLPLLPAGLLRELAARPGETVVPEAGGFLQPLAARYGAQAATVVREGMAASAPLLAVLERLEPTVIDEAELARFGDPAVMFTNVNSRADLARAEAHLRP